MNIILTIFLCIFTTNIVAQVKLIPTDSSRYKHILNTVNNVVHDILDRSIDGNVFSVSCFFHLDNNNTCIFWLGKNRTKFVTLIQHDVSKSDSVVTLPLQSILNINSTLADDIHLIYGVYRMKNTFKSFPSQCNEVYFKLSGSEYHFENIHITQYLNFKLKYNNTLYLRCCDYSFKQFSILLDLSWFTRSCLTHY